MHDNLYQSMQIIPLVIIFKLIVTDIKSIFPTYTKNHKQVYFRREYEISYVNKLGN